MKSNFFDKFKEVDNQIKSLFLCLIIFIATGNNAYSQESDYKKSSIRTAIGVGLEASKTKKKTEIGAGLFCSIGWQKSFWKKDKLRINPNLICGMFSPYGIGSTVSESYIITRLGLNVHYDLIRYESVSLVIAVGGFTNYSGGLDNSNRFHQFFFAVNASVGFRVDPKKSKLAYELKLLDLYFGNQSAPSSYLTLGIDFKLKK